MSGADRARDVSGNRGVVCPPCNLGVGKPKVPRPAGRSSGECHAGTRFGRPSRRRVGDKPHGPGPLRGGHRPGASGLVQETRRDPAARGSPAGDARGARLVARRSAQVGLHHVRRPGSDRRARQPAECRTRRPRPEHPVVLPCQLGCDRVCRRHLRRLSRDRHRAHGVDGRSLPPGAASSGGPPSSSASWCFSRTGHEHPDVLPGPLRRRGHPGLCLLGERHTAWRTRIRSTSGAGSSRPWVWPPGSPLR